MTGKIIACCGHEVNEVEDMVTVLLKSGTTDYETGYQKAVIESYYCRSCANKLKVWEDYLPNWEAARRWALSSSTKVDT